MAPACARVAAMDVSPVMLEGLRAKVSAARLPDVAIVQAGFLSYEASAQAMALAPRTPGCRDFVVAADPLEPDEVYIYEE